MSKLAAIEMDYLIMADIDKKYVQRYIALANQADSIDEKNNALYRAGTQMEVIKCNGNHQLTDEQQQKVLSAAKKLLGE